MQMDSTNAVHRIAKVASTSLVVASAGFGGFYAFRVGSEVSYALGMLTVLFAIALECLKPLAFAAAFAAFNSWAILRGLCLALLGLIAAAYSLTAELSLISMSRGDLAAHRSSTARQSTIKGERIDAARKELATLVVTRSVSELEALVEGTSCPGSRQVQVANGRRDTVIVANTHCTKLTKVKTELGRAKRKAELEVIIANAATSGKEGAGGGESDPGAVNLAIYLSALGLNISSETVGRWLALIPTLAIEIGSSLAAILVSSLAAQPKGNPAQPKDDTSQLTDKSTQLKDNAEQHKDGAGAEDLRGIARLIQLSQLAMAPVTQRVDAAPANTTSMGDNVIRLHQRAHTRQEAEAEILKQLQMHGSSLKWGAQRQMAFSLGIDRSTFNRAANVLQRRGVITVEQDGNRVVMRLTPQEKSA